MGPSYGDARFIDDDMDIMFVAASDGPSAYYSVDSMSDVTGSEPSNSPS